MKKLIFISICFVLLSACGSKTAEYYEQHPEEMKTKMLACSKMSEAEKMTDRECTAVINADSKRFFKSTIPRPGEPKGRATKQF
jgi:hypothetical protein